MTSIPMLLQLVLHKPDTYVKQSDLQNPRSEFRKKAITKSCHWINLVNKLVSDNTAAIFGPKKVYEKKPD